MTLSIIESTVPYSSCFNNNNNGRRCLQFHPRERTHELFEHLHFLITGERSSLVKTSMIPTTPSAMDKQTDDPLLENDQVNDEYSRKISQALLGRWIRQTDVTSESIANDEKKRRNLQWRVPPVEDGLVGEHTANYYFRVMEWLCDCVIV